MSKPFKLSLIARLRISQALVAVCIGLSIGWILYVIHVNGCDGDAGRGGAIADTVALIVIFFDRSFASRLYDLTDALNTPSTLKPSAEPMTKADVREEIKSLLSMQEADTKSQRLQNFFLAVATGFGTLSWGFGDLIARHFIGHHC